MTTALHLASAVRLAFRLHIRHLMSDQTHGAHPARAFCGWFHKGMPSDDGCVIHLAGEPQSRFAYRKVVLKHASVSFRCHHQPPAFFMLTSRGQKWILTYIESGPAHNPSMEPNPLKGLKEHLQHC